MWEVAALYDDETGDIALSTLTILGVPSEDRAHILNTLHQRVLKRCNTPLIFALRRLADPASLEVVYDNWLQPGRVKVADLERSQALYILTDMADALPEDGQLQDRIWKMISGLFEDHPDIFEKNIYFSGGFVPKCNSVGVVSNMLKWLGNEGGESDRAHHGRYLLYLRLAACVRPRQLFGWSSVNDTVALDLLRQDAGQDSRGEGLVMTSSGYRKEAAWATLLRLGHPGVLNWFEEAIATETHPYIRQKISNLLACLRFDPLPPIVNTLVTEPYDNQVNNIPGEFSARLGAIQIARSSASQEAFQALSAFGLTEGGQALQESADALIEVALFLTKTGDTSVAAVLVEIAAMSSSEHHRVAAAAALGSLATQDLLAGTYAPRLSTLLFDVERNDFERSLFVSVLGYLKEIELSAEVLQQLQTWALERNDWLGVRSLEALARHDQLVSQHDLLIKKLGLEQKEDGKWNLSSTPSRFTWTPFIVSLLYDQYPNIFTPAIVSLLHTQSWSGAVQVIRTLQYVHGGSEKPALPHDIERAFIKRMYQQQASSVAELDLIKILAQLVPDALGLEDWEQVWNDWLPDARAELANALGEANYKEPSAQSHAVSLLLKLTRDGQYAVRRAAYRGLAQQSSATLYALCAAWSEVAEIALRQRAAEAWGWLRASEEQSDTLKALYQHLSVDPEEAVRETIQQARQERRERAWAAEYREKVRAVATSGATNDDVLKTWCYGHALTQVGDDTAEHILTGDLQTRELPPHIRYWLWQIIKEMSERWRKVSQKWPEPWLTWEGTIEAGKGEIEGSNGQRSQVTYSLWQKPAATPSEKDAWGGTVWPIDFFEFGNSHDVVLHLEDGRQLTVLVTRISETIITFLGQGSYTV